MKWLFLLSRDGTDDSDCSYCLETAPMKWLFLLSRDGTDEVTVLTV